MENEEVAKKEEEIMRGKREGRDGKAGGRG
jgi:hypothetical protein